ncbi:galactose-binding domain-like protein [Phlyctochytrium arcticum]|nr:galactose-binding domain-like protein [Phlyctochytrium arcticum]
MSQCREHHHSQGGGDDQHEHHDHDHDGDGERGVEYTLYRQIDTDHIRCLNESEEDAAKHVFKTWEDRFDLTKYVESDADEQLIINIPFTANVKIKSISVMGGPDQKTPSRMKAFVNREDIDFDNAESVTETQEWELTPETPRGNIAEYGTRVAKFTNVRNLVLYFPENFGDDVTRIYYIGLKGEWSEIKKDPIITSYELAANPADHKTKSNIFMGAMIQ